MQAVGHTDESIEAGLKRSLEFATTQGARLFELRTAIQLANLWVRDGKRVEAQKLLRPICDSFIEGRDTHDVQKAVELLHGLE
jgi:hypothetical protein